MKDTQKILENQDIKKVYHYIIINKEMMLRFKNVHFYRNQANNLNFDVIVSELQKYFPSIPIDVRHHFLNDIDNVFAESLVSTRILDIKKPFSEQPRVKVQGRSNQNIAYERNLIQSSINYISNNNSTAGRQHKELILYDGFMLQRLFETMINENEANIDHVHIVFEDRLICTFSEEDWRYHARTVLGGSPSIISTSGIVEAPARPKEWHIKQMKLATYDTGHDVDENDPISLSKEKEKYLDYGDCRINFAAVGYALQALFFFLTEGNPFCNDINCRLYNAHWQEELIYSQIQNNRLCDKHTNLLDRFYTPSQ